MTNQDLYTECQEYATLGYSRTTVAGILGYSRSHFTREVLPRIDPERTIPWPSHGCSVAHREAVDEGRGRGKEWRRNLREAALNRAASADLTARNDEMRRLYNDGWTQREIGERFGMWQASVSRVLRGG